MKKNISVLFFTLIVSFFLTELLFRIFYPINLQSWYAELLDPEKSFVTLKKNYHHKIDRWNYKYYASYTLGEYRNRITQNTKNDNNVLILGDSFTFGLYLKDKDTYINKLQNKFNNFNLINSSTPGWGLEDYYLFTKNFCKEINPKKIIIILNNGDMGRIRKKVIISENKNISLKEKYKSYKFLVENFMTISFLRNNAYKIWNYNKKHTNDDLKDTTIYFDQNITKEIVKDSKKLFLKLKKEADNCGASLNVINLGWSDFRNHKKILNNPNQLFFKNEKNFFKNNQIGFFDNTQFLRNVHKNKEQFIIKNEGHPNELGADEIFNSLEIHFNKILI